MAAKIGMSSMTLLVLLMAWSTGAADHEGANISCPIGRLMMAPCEQYLLNHNVPTPGNLCCSAVRKLDSIAAAKENRQRLCVCLRDGLRSVSGLNLAHAKALPTMCDLMYLRFEPNAVCK
ncbi:non-specific lipid-transfer protein 1-like [Impatiens glandulifera]|uniref:non-specific lipid-transfer protein 1-like n=1 Tax=Impatiens glandulifera TaxID=253017 RepID=UPI001FB080A7|nr:non-specific lipid-transfer protein 1-like [Impatiens glandulifera]